MYVYVTCMYIYVCMTCINQCGMVLAAPEEHSLQVYAVLYMTCMYSWGGAGRGARLCCALSAAACQAAALTWACINDKTTHCILALSLH